MTQTTNQTTNQPANQTGHRTTCDETRSTRLHYRLRCLLPPGHDDDHAWTPELLPVDEHRASA